MMTDRVLQAYATPPIDPVQLILTIPRADRLWLRLRKFFPNMTLEEMDILVPPLMEVAGQYLRSDGVLHRIQTVVQALKAKWGENAEDLVRPYTLLIIAVLSEDDRLHLALERYVAKNQPPTFAGNA